MNKMTAWMKGLLLLTLMVGGQAGAEVETVTYLHTDHLGSPIMGRDASGNTVFREEYGPWGRQLNAATPSDDVTYTGHANEGDIGLTYMKARWYDPVVGRFLSPDPVTFDGGGAGYLKRYAYVHNNPYGSVDPTGEAGYVVGGGIAVAGFACTKVPACVTAVGSVIAAGVGWVAGSNSDSGVGAADAPESEVDGDVDEWIYGPEDDPKVNGDGSTTGPTWTTPDDYADSDEAQDKLDPFKPMDGRRPVRIPEGTRVRRGNTPGGEGPYNGTGGGNETLIENGLPPNSVGPWEPL